MTPLPKGLSDDRFDNPAGKRACAARRTAQDLPPSIACDMFSDYLTVVAQGTRA
jgi:hypothetical protein